MLKKTKKAQINILHIIVGIILIGGGTAYLLNSPMLGGLIAAIGLVIELAVNFANSLR